ncbi:GGDEF domain-containing protein [Bradyrhizobium diazoefficiens]|jgi:diguanylate cyclase|nr:GGDEF domain-containing protein [Bradyrhizobium diazoefficiens]UCF54139.1 MAG: GGDEF domain-containing protein [Bradyrhizobium sp.]MBR0968332.1 GGDEF domain-containing protein [Bradyrhizobium diazoefficiens]MBR0981690.1 GGDEF domain-containing protein [Bradyrhizobium diazoefficiens]MBR1011143.1 GGDEF domain-containing protein [Bradyrhizobium diazoefficiens]MBR1017643.1 GGDEF domain-containing protein [Bradyrhizobium diazoefficiens]
MLFDRMETGRASISDAVYMEVIAGLHGTTMPTVLAAVCQAMVGAITTFETGDMWTAALTLAGILVAIVRLLEIVAFRRRIAHPPRLGRAEAARWERRYIAGTVVTALVLGVFAARSILLGDAICMVMAIGIGFGFGAGVVARLSLRPVAALLDLVAIAAPAAVVTFMLPDLRHVGLGLLILMYVGASFEMVRLSFNASISQITLKRQFEQLARSDAMTGVFNRSVLAEDLPRMLADGTSGMIAVHALDLDRFKDANDRFGHPVGDALLKQVAGRLKALAAPDDLVVRMGGDEFILVQRVAADTAVMAERIVQSISAPYDVDGQAIELGVSVGVAVAPQDGRTAEALLSRSDRAMYRAKQDGGGYVLARELRMADGLAASDKPAAEGLAA